MKKEYLDAASKAAGKFISNPDTEARAEAVADQEATEEPKKDPEKKKPGRPKKDPAAEGTPKKRTRTKKTEPKKIPITTKHVEPQVPQQVVIRKNIVKEETKKAKKNGKPFSVWLQDEDIEALKLYCEVTKMPVTKVVTSALRIFLAENRLTESEKQAYFKELESIKDKINSL